MKSFAQLLIMLLTIVLTVVGTISTLAVVGALVMRDDAKNELRNTHTI